MMNLDDLERIISQDAGYPCLLTNPPTENDGPPGAIAIARALSTLGKQVFIFTDEDNHAVISATLCASKAAYGSAGENGPIVEVIAFPSGDLDDPAAIADKYGLDHVVAIERCGPSEDGACYTMRGRNLNLTQRIARLEQLFTLTVHDGRRRLKSIAIGDGGNEVGMGKRIAAVRRYIPLGDKIACVIEADHLIVAGVSNWGGFALAFALFDSVKQLPQAGTEFCLSKLEAALPHQAAELQVLRGCIAAGGLDGCTGGAEDTVDGLPWTLHASVISSLRAAVGLGPAPMLLPRGGGGDGGGGGGGG